jgi:SRSO17 transposase
MGVGDWSGSTLRWSDELLALKERLGPAFGRRELRETGSAFLDGLLSDVSRKTGWMLSEQAGFEHPARIQSLLGRSRWEADALRDAVQGYALEALGDPAGVLVVDETGFLKKGTESVGVKRQYSGTAGRTENCQVGVFLAYASRWGHTLIDRRLYLPKDWANDTDRRDKTAVPEETTFATKPALAREMIGAALDAGTACAWVLADAVYGSDSALRRMLEGRHQPYVLAVRSNHHLRFLTAEGIVQTDPAEIADALAPEDWHAHPAGAGAKGLRLYDWACIAMPWVVEEGYKRWMLIRRSRSDPTKRAYSMVFAPEATTLAEMAGAAGLRWTIEECFQHTKGDLGLDHCEARSWHGWHRHMSLVMAAAAFLATLAAKLRKEHAGTKSIKPDKTSPHNHSLNASAG